MHDFGDPSSSLFCAVLVAVGFAAGLIGSLLGLGSGWLIVPALNIMGISAVMSVGTSLATMLITTTFAVVQYARRGMLAMRLGLAFGIPALVGVQAGRTLLAWLDRIAIADTFLRTTYIVLLLGMGVAMGRDSRTMALPTTAPQPSAWPVWGPVLKVDNVSLPWYQAIVSGMVAGLLSGILGIGGGLILVPLMTMVFHLPVLTAVATSLVSVLIASLHGTLLYAFAGHVVGSAIPCLACGSVIGSSVGVALSRFADERVLKRLFAALTLLTAASMLAREVKWPLVSRTILFGGTTLGVVTILVQLLGSWRRAKQRGDS